MNVFVMVAVVAASMAVTNANATCWVIRQPRVWVVSESPVCRCDDCRCEACQCGLVRKVALASPCPGGVCEVGAPCSAPPAVGGGHCGNCAGNGASDGLVAGQPVRNAGRLLRGAAGVVRNQLARGVERRQERRQERREIRQQNGFQPIRNFCRAIFRGRCG